MKHPEIRNFYVTLPDPAGGTAVQGSFAIDTANYALIASTTFGLYSRKWDSVELLGFNSFMEKLCSVKFNDFVRGLPFDEATVLDLSATKDNIETAIRALHPEGEALEDMLVALANIEADTPKEFSAKLVAEPIIMDGMPDDFGASHWILIERSENPKLSAFWATLWPPFVEKLKVALMRAPAGTRMPLEAPKLPGDGDFRWYWGYGNDPEDYYGGYDTRDEALAAVQLETDGKFTIVEAERALPDVNCFDADAVLEEYGDINEELWGEDGAAIEVSRAQRDELEQELADVLQRWADRHQVHGKVYAFASMRNFDTVDVSPDSPARKLAALPGIVPVITQQQELPGGLFPSTVGLDPGDFYYDRDGVTAGLGFADIAGHKGALNIWTMSADQQRQGKGRAFLQAVRPLVTHIVAQGVEDGDPMKFWKAMFDEGLVDEIVGYGVTIDRGNPGDPEPGFSPYPSGS